MNEFELIRLLTAPLPQGPAVVVGPGDDCAVLDLGLPDRQVLFKTDAIVEGVHFETTAPPEKVGHKALGRCLSDIAAMAGTPVAALVTLALPGDRDPRWAEAVYAGLRALASGYAVSIVGGETTSHPTGALISVALLGTVPKGKAVLRIGAVPGDALFVTGELGGSLAGRHLEFEPRLDEARWLAERWRIHAMIDVSDGLAGDLRHLLAASSVGAELLARAIPVSRAARAAARRDSRGGNGLREALSDGEDFELLFTVASCDAVPLTDAWKVRFPTVRLTCIGKITAENGFRIRDARGVREVQEHGYVHFEQSR